MATVDPFRHARQEKTNNFTMLKSNVPRRRYC